MDSLVTKSAHNQSRDRNGRHRRVSSFKSRENFSKSPEKRKIRRSDSIPQLDPTLSLTKLLTKVTERKDAFGTLILRGSKIHKVSFIDEIYRTDLVDYLEDKPSKGNEVVYCKEKAAHKPKLTNEEKSSTRCTACILI